MKMSCKVLVTHYLNCGMQVDFALFSFIYSGDNCLRTTINDFVLANNDTSEHLHCNKVIYYTYLHKCN